MATNALFQTYDFGFSAGSSNREDLSDVIVNIAPWETPLFSTAPKITVSHTVHEWLEDTLTAASAQPYSASFYEGADFSAQNVANRTRLLNFTQIFRKDIKISETQRAVNPAGIRDEYQYQVGLAMKEIARHIETALFSPTDLSATGGATTYRTMKGLASFLAAPATGPNRLFSGSASAGSVGHGKVLLDQIIESCFINGGAPTRVYCHPNSKTQFANALGGTAVNYRNIAASDARVIANIDVYTSNFNVIELIPDRFVPSGSATISAASLVLTGASGASGGRYWLLDQSHVKIGWLRPMKHVAVPPAGDAVRGMILGELTLVVEATGAHAEVYNIVTA